MDCYWPSKEGLETLGKGVALVALLFSIGTSFFNQYQNRAQERYEATRRLIERYVEDGVLSPRPRATRHRDRFA